MTKKILHIVISFLLVVPALSQNSNESSLRDTFVFAPDTTYRRDSIVSDSNFYLTHLKLKLSILDTLRNDSLLNSIFKPYLSIRNRFVEKLRIQRNFPTAKEIQNRPLSQAPWKFWVIIFIIQYIAIIRMINPGNFNTFIYSVFNLKLSQKIWEEQRSAFAFTFFQLFAIYLFIAALFITFQLELRNIQVLTDSLMQFFAISGILALIYFGKFLLHAILGYLLRMNKLAIGFVSNTISVNNFIALVIFPLIIFMNYHFDPLWSVVFSQSIVGLFFISILYRVLRIFMLRGSFFSFPVIYLILYLCSLELLPWLIIIKYLNTVQL